MKQDTEAGLALGIECGGTHTVALAVDARGAKIGQVTAGPANLRLLNDTQLVGHFRALGQSLPAPRTIAIGMAGARLEADRARIRHAAAQVWPGVSCYATNDLETGLMAGADELFEGRRSAKPAGTRVLILSGTGSCCFGGNAQGRTAKVGGWGHLLGDRGSGYEIGLRALQAVVHYWDQHGQWPDLGARLLRTAQLNEGEELVGWIQNASKTEIARLAIPVFEAWHARDPMATKLLRAAAGSLARDAADCARRLTRRGTPAHFVMAGSVLLKQPRFAALVRRELRPLWAPAVITPLKRESVWGAVVLAREQAGQSWMSRVGKADEVEKVAGVTMPEPPADLRALTASPTEQRNPRSMNLDKLPVAEAIELMLSEDAKIPAAILKERDKIARVIEWITRAFRQGGRLFYVGAGTSGRLGVLDASECPPTFQTPTEMVQGIMAGGLRALWDSIEGAEDDAEAGARAMEGRGIGSKDVVVGIAASGRTPFVWGAIQAAKERKAKTVLLTLNPTVVISQAQAPAVIIAPNVGPEILTGSTRLKAGTATKLVLNLFTTLAMVRFGKVISNLMVDVNASNVKLRDRATRILQALTGADYATAQSELVRHHWQIKAAYRALGSMKRK